MISRKKILSRSQSEIDYPLNYNAYECEDDVWFNKDKLYADHIEEILKKWEQIDDEIWGKIICMERNRRIAKAYARVPVLTVNGSNDGFDGYKIGLSGFENTINDPLVKRVKTHIGKGVRVKIDDLGNVIIKRMSNCDVFIRGWDPDSNSVSTDIMDLSGELEFDKSVKLFDMKKFQHGISKELRSAYPDRRKLENQCICCIGFVKDAADVLDLPVWCMIINIVALDMLKSRLPPIAYKAEPVPKFVSIFDKHGNLQQQQSQEEDPYSVPSLPISGKSTNMNNAQLSKTAKKSTTTMMMMVSDQKPPELPPRDLNKIKKNKNIPKVFRSMVKEETEMKMKVKDNEKKQIMAQEYEDPYYCGMRARVSNFGVRANLRTSNKNTGVAAQLGRQTEMRKTHSNGYLNSLFNPASKYYHHTKASSYYSYYDSSFESDPYAVSSADGYDLYAPIYGRVGHGYGYAPSSNTRRALPLKEQNYHSQRYATEWD